MKRTDKHSLAIKLILNQIDSYKHEQESQFLAGESNMVNNTQDVINQLTSSLIALNELSITKPLRSITKLRKAVEKKNRDIEREKEKRENDGSITFDTMWNDNQVCAIVPLRILEEMTNN